MITIELIAQARKLADDLRKAYVDAAPRFLPDDLRHRVSSYAVTVLQDGMFGDGLENDYLWGGTTIIGVEELTDQELVELLAELSMLDENDGYREGTQELADCLEAERLYHNLIAS